MSKLEEVLTDFENLRESFLRFKNSGDLNDKVSLCEFLDRFNDLHARLVPFIGEAHGLRTRHDDKAASSIKARICRTIQDGKHGEIPPEKSWTKTEVLAAATSEYEEFLKNRATHYETWEVVQSIVNVIRAYTVAINTRINKT